ncbi:AtpZ/AtpI family protein [Bacillus sp. FJAT-42376]|uniref:AtpZ/AtpI family protein n=1 Tax=Bacillus sp. FJAT-42376 TaxID=2014076 RepID=UPI000F4F528D|nr:AtpZ/AtpI family protein [Bacillus sp. FJAT-42376]AZB40906.1 AtpZ/AtpI family protein [Bacillus sp. FJAT-42376]
MNGKNRHPLQAMALMSGILSHLVGSVLVGVFAGRWLDGYLHTVPLFLITGLLLGLSAGVYGMLKLIRHYFPGD